MKLKISWPTAIIVSIVAFMIFILSFVYKVTFLPEYDHHLVSEEYYKDELNYQKEIDKEKKGLSLKENVSFQRLSNSKIDFEYPIKLKTNEFLIKDENLINGRWDVKIEWNVADNNYLFKEKLMY